MSRAYYSDSIAGFLKADPDTIVGALTRSSPFGAEPPQVAAWLEQIRLLKEVLSARSGSIHFEFSIPRMGRRVDTVLIIGPVVFVLEFKVGEVDHTSHAIDQVTDYALDLKNFHEASHSPHIAPILISTEARPGIIRVSSTPHRDNLLCPILTSGPQLKDAIEQVLEFAKGDPIDHARWEQGRYSPTPTIIEAAMALYANHSVADIARSDAGAINLAATSDCVSQVIADARNRSRKAICFVTGVPGAGKTLVGLNIATKHIDKKSALHSVFLSGNGPLVAILGEALARDKVARELAKGTRIRKGVARSEVQMFIQNVHHFRDDCLEDKSRPPLEHVALFDEAQRAWNSAKTIDFMRRKKGVSDFKQSEPEFLISCLDRHVDWAVIVCLVGGGQEINSGEAGISEWVDSLERSFPKWDIHLSSRLRDSEYGAGRVLETLKARDNVTYDENLHLGVSMRSFRAEDVSLLVKQLLDLDAVGAKATYSKIRDRFPMALTRDPWKAKKWLRDHARGSERYGMLASSQAERLKPHAIDVKSPMDPIHWFLDGKEDVRSSYYLEDVATEFHIQGLELDWACTTWDADLRYGGTEWEHRTFCGDRWNNIRKTENQAYQKNAYRVLLTRARQGMVICVPEGEPGDPTRKPEYYDPTFKYLERVGFPTI